ncbi:MAG: M23 family metallopeptidase [Ruaniaceae bacterium]|nr:M23 family metallopeptidase [Ruaniaceae bacterium]
MSEAVAPEHQLTRRQLREQRESAATVTPPPVQSTRTTMQRDFAQTETLPIATRKDLRREASRPALTRTPTHAPRAAVLVALGIATIAAPLTGFVTPEHSAQAIGVGVATSAPLAQSLAAAAAASQIEGAVPTSSALAANPSAAAIALDLSARDQARTVSACTAIEGASGVREANVQRTSALYYPMAAGTYRNTSQFGPRWGSFHAGTDMAAAAGTPMYAVTDGTVVHAGDGIEGRSGNLVIVHSVVNGQDVWFWYGHMYDNGVYVSEGQEVSAGQLLGGVGSMGYSTGPHLHFEVHAGEWSNVVSPLGWLSDSGAVSPGTC